MGQLILAVTFLLLALLVGTGLYLESSTDLLAPDSPLDIGADLGFPEDGQDGNVVVEIGKEGAPPAYTPRGPDDPHPWDVITRLTHDEKSKLHGRGYLPYVVKRGDSLSSLATRYLGKAKLWKVILEHNRSRMLSASDLRPGMTVEIPTWLREDF